MCQTVVFYICADHFLGIHIVLIAEGNLSFDSARVFREVCIPATSAEIVSADAHRIALEGVNGN